VLWISENVKSVYLFYRAKLICSIFDTLKMVFRYVRPLIITRLLYFYYVIINHLFTLEDEENLDGLIRRKKY